MIIQFNKNDVTFFDEDQAYFEKRLSGLTKFLGKEAGDEDSVKIIIQLGKDKHQAGKRFHAKAHMTCPHRGSFHAESNAENIKKLADKLKDTLEIQVKKFHEKKTG